jgi:Terminase large subunit, T4likevirus-type, N-terminal
VLARDLTYALDPIAFAQAAGIVCDPWQGRLLEAPPRRGILNCSRQSGKTTTTGLIALHRAIYEAGALVVVVSPSQRQSAEMLRTIKQLHSKIEGVPELGSESVLKLELQNGSRILALPGSERTVRGFGGVSLVVIDEAARVPDELLQAVTPMLATRADGSLIMLSTPAGKRGFFHDIWHNGDPSWTRVRVSADDCPRISKQFLDEQLRELGAVRFSEEFQLAFVDAEDSAFPTDIITRAFTKELKPLWA